MPDQLHFSATEARQNFFELLRLAQKGKIVTIEKRDEDVQFQLQKKPNLPKKDIVKIAKEMGKIGLKAPSDPQKLKQIILDSKNIDLTL